MRRFTAALGATAPATSATLSALFLGLAIGSALFGAIAPGVRRPLRAFALCEAGIGAAAFLVEPLLSLATPLLASGAAQGFAATLAARMGVAMAAILPAAILMGGSFPLLAESIARLAAPGESRDGGLGTLGSGLYAVNTLGAALGALAVPVALLPLLGARGALLAAVAANIAVALIALMLDATLRGGDARTSFSDCGPGGPRTLPGGPRTLPPSQRTLPPSPRPLPGGPRTSLLLLLAAFFSGAAMLGMEVLWTRMLALVHENSVHSFATVLAIFLVCLGASALGVRALLARSFSARTIAGAGWMGAGAWIIATPSLFHWLSSGLRYVSGSGSLLRHEIRIAGLALAAMLPAALLAGAALPALMELAGGREGPARAPRRQSAGSAFGALLSANTIGAIAGPLVALFVIGPALGLWWGMVVCGAVMLAVGEIVLASREARASATRRRRSAGRPALRLVTYAALAAVLFIARPGDLPRVRLTSSDRLVSVREGPFGTVAVVDKGGNRRLMLNNYYVLGGTASTPEERLAGHIPLLLHPHPRRVAFLGLGTGITTSASLFHPVDEVVAMELVPEVVAAARQEFREANIGVTDDARVRILVEDARAGLRVMPGRFDVIVGDLVVPWRRGEAALFTKESFDSARGALAPDGIFCQWVPLFQLTQREFQSIAATFLDVFPQTVLFKGDFFAGEPAVGLIGITSTAPLDPSAIEARVRQYAAAPDPANPQLTDPAGLWLYLAGPLSLDDAGFGTAQRNTDARPLVELSSPLSQLSGAGRNARFLGTELKTWLEEVLARPLAGTSLQLLGEDQLRYRIAGHEIWSASLLELQGKRAEADALGLTGLSRLPEPLRRVMSPESPAIP